MLRFFNNTCDDRAVMVVTDLLENKPGAIYFLRLQFDNFGSQNLSL